MGIDVGGFYFGLEKVEAVALYNDVDFKFTKKRKRLLKKAVNSHNQHAVVSDFFTMTSSYDTDRFVTLDVISKEDREEESYELKRRKKAEGKKGVAEYMKTSFGGAAWELYGVPYAIGKTKERSIEILEPTKIDDVLTDAAMECNSKTIYWLFNDISHRVSFELFYWSDYSFYIPTVTLSYIKNLKSPLNQYLADALIPVPEEVLEKLDQALQDTIKYFEDSSDSEYDNATKVKTALTEAVRAIKEHKTIAIVDVSR